jgi:hypothetical protein
MVQIVPNKEIVTHRSRLARNRTIGVLSRTQLHVGQGHPDIALELPELLALADSCECYGDKAVVD